MNYVDGFVVAVPTVNREKYLRYAQAGAAVFKEYAGGQGHVVPHGCAAQGR